LVFLNRKGVTLPFIFLYCISYDYISMRVISTLLIWNLFLEIFLSCFNLLDYRWRVIYQLAIYYWNACCETKCAYISDS
jgi:hypothetical protein